MAQLGFTEPGRWEDDNDTLTRCVVRYHHFLDLMSSAAGKFAVPTLVNRNEELRDRGLLLTPSLARTSTWRGIHINSLLNHSECSGCE